MKVANKASHYAIVGVAAVVTVGGDGRCERVRIGVTGTSPTPFRALAAEAILTGRPPDTSAISEAAGAAAGGVEAIEDVHASAEFRLHLTRVHARRALELAVTRAMSG